MSLIDGDELEEFNNAISARGLSADDFELTKHDEPMHGVEVQPLGYQVVVERESTGVIRAYNAGSVSNWVADFIHDLNRGVFDKKK